ncbi:MAG: PD-(D/E)XK nuclease family transposase [Bacteroidaceae bacterium]|nr:PD-(D/E)XK nuclease family transposase [Bacteroidaceae bacterium]
MGELASHERYANFYTDFAFKKLFGTEANKECLISFLNALFDGKEEISDLTYLNVEHFGAAASERKAVFDVLCENPQGEKFLIEMQKAVFKRFFEQAEIANFSQEERRDYRESQKDFWDLFAVTETAEKKGRAEGRAEGLAEGEAIGLEKGEAIGVEKRNVQIARNLKAMCLNSEQIAQATGLTIDEINGL